MPENEDDCKKIEQAFLQATKVFDDSAVRVLIFHLEEKYHVHIGCAPCSSVEEIYTALLDIAGSAADLLISRMRSNLR